MKESKAWLCVDAITADIADMLAKDSGIAITAALQKFMQSKTYALLFDENSLLCLESAEYVYDMLQAEQRGDWERWREE
ncbi:MAG: hypothetical protein LBS85_07590 [Clostridiales Family XIII bacterium]|jgi:hypothetical protein|nr:hypothetical protein [Clostridiales Family XIII bacterium]